MSQLTYLEERGNTIARRTEWLTIVFFFSSRRRHTRLQGDWSSDVCSSDLADDAQRQWLLPFSVRGALAADGQDTGDRSARQGRLADAVALIERIFGSQAQEVTAKEVRQLRQSLERRLGPRED